MTELAPIPDVELVPPQNLEAEESVIGAMLLSANACDTATELLNGTEFCRESHGRIFRAAASLHASGEPVDAITVTHALEQTGDLDTVGGRIRLHELAAIVPATANVRHYIGIVKNAAISRSLIRSGGEIARLGWERAEDGVDRAEQIIYKLAGNTSGETDLSPRVVEFAQTLERLRTNPGEMIGIPSGYSALDKITHGFVPGNLIVVGARPSMGKSALALCITEKLLRRGLPVAVISAEMSKAELNQRLVSIVASVPSQLLMEPRKLNAGEWGRVMDAAVWLNKQPLYVSDEGTVTPAQIRSTLRRLKTRVPLACVFVDYLQLMTTGGRHSGDNRVQEVSEISRALKMTARDLELPIVALSQLSRAVEQRTDKRPLLSDLRESGSIEQDADVVLSLFRESYYTGDEPPNGWLDKVEVAVLKHRNGPTGRIELGFKREQALFTEIRAGLADMGSVAA